MHEFHVYSVRVAVPITHIIHVIFCLSMYT